MTIRIGKASFRTSAVLMLLSLGACATPPPAKFPEITFSHLPKISLDVAAIQVVDGTAAVKAGNHVETQIPASPRAALMNWARDRLSADGGAGLAKFIIEEASVVETDLAVNSDLKAKFTKEQAQRYDANVRVTLKLEGVPYLTQAQASAEAMRSQTVREDANINQRDTVLFEMVETLMREFDPAMSQSIRRHLGNAAR